MREVEQVLPLRAIAFKRTGTQSLLQCVWIKHGCIYTVSPGLWTPWAPWCFFSFYTYFIVNIDGGWCNPRCLAPDSLVPSLPSNTQSPLTLSLSPSVLPSSAPWGKGGVLWQLVLAGCCLLCYTQHQAFSVLPQVMVKVSFSDSVPPFHLFYSGFFSLLWYENKSAPHEPLLPLCLTLSAFPFCILLAEVSIHHWFSSLSKHVSNFWTSGQVLNIWTCNHVVLLNNVSKELSCPGLTMTLRTVILLSVLKGLQCLLSAVATNSLKALSQGHVSKRR